MDARDSSLTIRPAGPSDEPALVESRVALFRELGKAPPDDQLGPFRESCRERIGALLAAGGAFAWVAVDAAGAVRGSTVLLVYPRLPTPADLHEREGYVLNVYVDPACRGRGAATAMMAAAMEQCRRLGLGRARLHTTEAGRPIYERFGFRLRTDSMEARL